MGALFELSSLVQFLRHHLDHALCEFEDGALSQLDGAHGAEVRVQRRYSWPEKDIYVYGVVLGVQ